MALGGPPWGHTPVTSAWPKTESCRLASRPTRAKVPLSLSLSLSFSIQLSSWLALFAPEPERQKEKDKKYTDRAPKDLGKLAASLLKTFLNLF